MADAKEFVQSLYDAFGRGDAETVLDALSDDVTWNEAEGSPYADRNPYTGPSEVGEDVFGRLMADFDDFTVSPREMVAEGDHVVALGRYTGTRKDTGERLDAQFAHHWTVRDGKVVRFQQYTDTAQYVELAGGGS